MCISIVLLFVHPMSVKIRKKFDSGEASVGVISFHLPPPPLLDVLLEPDLMLLSAALDVLRESTHPRQYSMAPT